MKSFFSTLLAAIFLCLSGCNPHIPSDTDATTKYPFTEPSGTDSSENSTTETNPLETTQLPLPNESAEFSFLSGAGGWRTVMTVNRDGSFSGMYLDSEMGEIGEDYPKGSAYTCSFSGKFDNIEKINAYSYKMTLTDVRTKNVVGEEWIADGIRYVATDPYGLSDPTIEQKCTEFIFYLPDTPVDQVPKEFLSWWPFRYSQQTDPKATLSCYGILNVVTNYGFFYTE